MLVLIYVQLKDFLMLRPADELKSSGNWGCAISLHRQSQSQVQSPKNLLLDHPLSQSPSDSDHYQQFYYVSNQICSYKLLR
jgi:hypothetical protein